MILGDALEIKAIVCSTTRPRSYLYLLTVIGPSAVIRPVMLNGKILAVTQRSKVKLLYAKAPLEFRELGPIPDEVYDYNFVEEAVDVVRIGSVDEYRTVIVYLNDFFDYLGAIGQTMPASYKKILWDLADHMTMSNDVASFFSNEKQRIVAVNAMTWLYGAVMLKTDVIR